MGAVLIMETTARKSRKLLSGKNQVKTKKTTEPDKRAALLQNKRKKHTKYIDMIISVLSQSKAENGYSKQQIMDYISDKYGLTKDAKTARRIRAACEAAWKKGTLIKVRYGRDNISYKLDTKVSQTKDSKSKRLGVIKAGDAASKLIETSILNYRGDSFEKSRLNRNILEPARSMSSLSKEVVNSSNRKTTTELVSNSRKTKRSNPGTFKRTMRTAKRTSSSPTREATKLQLNYRVLRKRNLVL